MILEPFDAKKYFTLISQISNHFKNSDEYRQVVDLLFDCWQNGGTVFTEISQIINSPKNDFESLGPRINIPHPLVGGNQGIQVKADRSPREWC